MPITRHQPRDEREMQLRVMAMTQQGKAELERLLRGYLGLPEGASLPEGTSVVAGILAYEYPPA
jgi:hypothetical protein